MKDAQKPISEITVFEQALEEAADYYCNGLGVKSTMVGLETAAFNAGANWAKRWLLHDSELLRPSREALAEFKPAKGTGE